MHPDTAATKTTASATPSRSVRRDRAAAWATILADYRRYQIAAGHSPATRKLRMTYARMLADEVGKHPHRVRTDDLVRFMANRTGLKPASRGVVLSCMRNLFAWMQTTGRRHDNPAVALPKVRVPAGVPRPCPERAVAAGLSVADQRTRLMIELAAFAGLRCAEIAAVHSSQLTYTADGPALTVTGKGGKTRTVPVSDELAAAIAARPGWTFPAPYSDTHIQPTTVGRLVARSLPEGWTAHTLRHRFASVAYRAERDLRAVQQLLGHNSIATTELYTAVPDDARRRAASATHTVGGFA